MNRVEKLQDFLSENPNDCFVLHALGLEYLKDGKTDQARDCFLRVLETDPNYVGTYYHLGKTYEQLGQETAAMNTYQKGIQIALQLNDRHSRSELETAVWELGD